MQRLSLRSIAVASLVVSLIGCGGGTADRAPLSPQTSVLAVAQASIVNGSLVETDATSPAAQVFRLYRAAFNRASDAAGLGYHIARVERVELALVDISSNFIASPEFTNRYGSLSNSQFVTQLYRNVLERDPDPGGLSYHVARLNSGVDRAAILVGFSESPENKTATSGAISAGIVYEPYLAPADGQQCLTALSADVVTGMTFTSVNTTNIQPYNCQVVQKAGMHPVADGSQSLRVGLKPGDCGANSGFDDCANDRSRFELGESSTAQTNGQVLIYEARIQVPVQARFKPKGENLLFISQLNYEATTAFGTLAYLRLLDDGKLVVQTHKGFTFDVLAQYPVSEFSYGKWMTYRVEVKSTTASDGYIRAWVDGRLVMEEIRPTLPPAPLAVNRFRVGIYNAYKVQATEPYIDQTIYFDGLKRSQ